jgi:GxxExxY protein
MAIASTPNIKYLNDRLFHVNTVDDLQAYRFNDTNFDRMRARMTMRKTGLKLQRSISETERTQTRSMCSTGVDANVEDIKDETFQTIIDIARTVFDQYGIGNTERVYQEAMYFSAYKSGIPCLMERSIHIVHDDMPLLIGRVDLEVDNKLVFELKIHAFNAVNFRKDRVQLQKYLRAYAQNNQVIENAALIYFGEKGVHVVNVTPYSVNSVNV